MKILVFILSWSCFFNFLSAKECKIESLSTLLDKVKEHHPDYVSKDHDVRISESDVYAAKESINPELSISTGNGSSADGESYSLGGGVSVTFETFGKRKNRVELARKQSRVFVEERNEILEQINIDSTLTAFRIKQKRQIISSTKRVIKLFNDVLKRYGKVKLDPSAFVDRSVLRMTITELELNLSNLQAEVDNDLRHLQFYVGRECSIGRKVFDNLSVQRYLDLPSEGSNDQYISLKRARLLAEVAKSSLKLEKSNSVPNLTVGTEFAYEGIGLSRGYSVGVNLSFELPLFNTNKGAKLAALKTIEKKSRAVQLTQEEQLIDLQAWRKRHTLFKSSLDGLKRKEDAHENFRKILNFFKRGIVSISNVTDYRKQLLDFESMKNEYELGVVESFLEYARLKGEVLKK